MLGRIDHREARNRAGLIRFTIHDNQRDKMIMINKPKFQVGKILSTAAALEELEKAGQNVHEFLARHIQGDWGCVCAEDATANDESIRDGSRILSAYVLKTNVKIWLITEAADDRGQRSSSTFLLPQEY